MSWCCDVGQGGGVYVMPVGSQKPTLLSNDDNISRLCLRLLSESNIELYHTNAISPKYTYL